MATSVLLSEAFDEPTHFVIGDVEVVLDTPDEAIRVVEVSLAVAEGTVGEPRFVTASGEVLRHGQWTDGTLVKVESHDGLLTPTVFLVTVRFGDEVVAVEQTRIEWCPLICDEINERFFIDVNPWRLNHHISELTIFLKSLWFCRARLSKLAENFCHLVN